MPLKSQPAPPRVLAPWIAEFVADLPALVPIPRAMQALDISRTTLWRAAKGGRLTMVNAGRRRLISRESLVKFLSGSV